MSMCVLKLQNNNLFCTHSNENFELPCVVEGSGGPFPKIIPPDFGFHATMKTKV